MTILQIQHNFAHEVHALQVSINDDLHRCNLRYLELALLYLKRGYPIHAARQLREFIQAEESRYLQRKSIKCAPPSPHEARQMVLKEALKRMIDQSLPSVEALP